MKKKSKKKKSISPGLKELKLENAALLKDLQETLAVKKAIAEVNSLWGDQLKEAQECLKLYTRKDQIGELANPAIELLQKWGIS